MKVGKSFWWVLTLFLLCILLELSPVGANNTIFVRLAIVWGTIILLSFIWARLSLSGLRVFRRSRILRQQVGQVFMERFDIINQNSLGKLWLRVIDLTDLPGSNGSRIISNLRPHTSKSYTSNTMLQFRGIFNLGPTLLTSGDVLGLFTFSKIIQPQSKLLVLPYLIDINVFPAPYGTLPGGRALHRKTTEVTPFAAGVREYSPGDPLRRIHWFTSARKQKLIVKEFEQDPLAEVWIFLDASLDYQLSPELVKKNEKDPDAFFWMGMRPRFELPPSSLEYAISIAASIAKYYILRKREVGVFVSGQSSSIIPAEKGDRQLEKILGTLAIIQAGKSVSLSTMVEQKIGSLVRGSTVVLITSSVSQEIVDSALDLLMKNLNPLIILMEPQSFGGTENSALMEEKCHEIGVKLLRVSFGENISSALSNR